MKNTCDMCGSQIHNKKCSCGEWLDPEETKDNPIKKAIEHFHEMKRFSLTADMPHLGCALVLFRGDYSDCEAVVDFLNKRKGRPYYEDGK